MSQPDFLIIGTPKSGTTSVYHYLQQHPQIFMSSLKEPHFFLFDGPEAPPMNGPFDAIRSKEMVKFWAAYQALFKDKGDALMCGEASIRYLYSEQACAAIRRRLPQTKLIVILRNPADRAFSSYQHERGQAIEACATFEQALAEGERREREGWFIGAHQSLGFYARYLKTYFEHFERDQVRVYLYDDLRQDASGTLRDMFDFLGVETGFQPNLAIQYNVTGTIKSPLWRFLWLRTRRLRAHLLPFIPIGRRGRFFDFIASKPVEKSRVAPMSPATRTQLLTVYRDDILALQDLIERDLSHWLEARPAT